jgi:arylsulfatase A
MMRQAMDHRWSACWLRSATTFFLIACFAILFSTPQTVADPLPNIVYILADDMGIGDVRSYTANSPVNTPNIDRIATAGMRFTDAHSPDSVCTPTRYGILTGQYGWRTSLQSGVLEPYAPPLISANRLTVAQMLKSSGYDTGAFGKWHLGVTWQTTNGQAPNANGSNVDHSQPFTNGPIDRGFDTFFGVDSANHPPYAFIRNNRTVGSDLVTPAVPTGQVYGNPSNPASNRLGPIVPGFDIHDTLPTVVSQATSFIGAKANQANPFFAYVPLTSPHEPLVPPSFATGQSGVTGAKQAYGDFIWTTDWAVGQILDKLSDPDGNPNTNDSIANNTIVVFTADNGAAKFASFATSTGSINGVPLRGDKQTVYEGGFRVPFLAQWPGHIPAGAVNNHIVELNDLMTSVATLTNSTLPTNSAEDSLNIMPELLGTASTPVRSINVGHAYVGAMTIRQTDSAGNNWKLIFTSGDGGLGAGEGAKVVDPKSQITDFSKLQLYNLTTDVGESTNLLSGGGTAASQQKALQLQKILQGYIYAGRSTNVPPRTSTNGTTTMLVDFGLNTQQTNLTGWNNLAGGADFDPSFAKGLYDQGGGYTGIVLKSSFVNAGSSTGVCASVCNYNGPYPSELTAYPADALKDGFFVSDGQKLRMTLENLDAHATYDFLFYAGAANFIDYSLFTVTGNTSQQGSITPVKQNATQVLHIDGIMADASGMIRIDVEGRRADGSLQNPSISNDAAGEINFMRIIEHLLEVPGDFNNDRYVDSADYAAWQSAYGNTGPGLAADGNHDGTVDLGDFVIWRKAVQSITPGAGAAPEFVFTPNIPEPTSCILAILGLFTLFAASARRRR